MFTSITNKFDRLEGILLEIICSGMRRRREREKGNSFFSRLIQVNETTFQVRDQSSVHAWMIYSRYETWVAEIAPQILKTLATMVTITVELAR